MKKQQLMLWRATVVKNYQPLLSQNYSNLENIHVEETVLPEPQSALLFATVARRTSCNNLDGQAHH